MGTMRDLLFICLLFVALKLDGIAAYTWSVVFLIPWMWYGALLLGAVVVSQWDSTQLHSFLPAYMAQEFDRHATLPEVPFSQVSSCSKQQW